jgi:hypothetical protein
MNELVVTLVRFAPQRLAEASGSGVTRTASRRNRIEGQVHEKEATRATNSPTQNLADEGNADRSHSTK